jgi:hypothetical protein
MVWSSLMLLATILVFSASFTAADELRDDGFGACPAFQDYRANDGKCHRDDNDEVVPDTPNPLLDEI